MDQNITQEENNIVASIWEKLSYYLLLGLTFLLPIFFIPTIKLPFELTKVTFLAVVILVAFIFTIVAQLKDNSFKFVKGPLMWSAALIPIIFAGIALIGGHGTVSFLGQGIEIGTVSFVALMFVLMYITPLIASTRERVLNLYTAFIVSFIVVGVFHTLRLLIGPEFLSFGLLLDPTSNVIGKWNDLAAFFGAGALLSFLTLQFFNLGKSTRILLNVLYVAALVFMIVINFTVGWYALVVAGIIVFVYKFKKGDAFSTEGSEGKKFSVGAVVLVVLSLFMIFGGKLISEPLATGLNINHLEVRPSFGATMDVAFATLKESPLFGSGPNRFLNQFLAHKPEGVNLSIFWNTDFKYGVGLILTFLVTTGVIGFLAWLAFLSAFVFKGVRSIFSEAKDQISAYLAVSSFLVSLYFWVIAIFYIPSSVIFTLTFIFTGLFIAVLVLNEQISVASYESLRSTKGGMMFTGVLGLSLIALIVWTGFYGKQFVAGALFQKSILSINQGGDLAEAEKGIVRAASISKNDIFQAALVEIDLVKLNQILNSDPAGKEQEVVKEIERILQSAVLRGTEATKIDENNYQNWLSLGRVYETAVPLKVPQTYESALAAYTRAIELNPYNPSLYLMLARLDLANGKRDQVKNYINKALEIKGNYTEAVYLLSQIQVEEGNIKEAIGSVEKAVELSPNDPILYFQLGLLRYNDNNFLGTIDAMTKAVVLNNDYSNARYFMGLSLARIGKSTEAIEQFDAIQKLNPENQEVALILKNLRAGRQPFTDATPPVDNKPEARTQLPVQDR